jgi:hypothetical protein
MTRPPVPEFSRTVPVDQIGADGCEFDIRAEPRERAALAERFGLVAIDALTARVHLERARGRKTIRLAATFHAEVTQTCVVTLEPVEAVLDQDFVIHYAETKAGEDAAEVVVSLDDDTEPLVGPVLDMGEAVAEELALSLDPYPRRPDAAIESGGAAGPDDAAPAGAFAVLASKFRKD